jgi:hypothetical protein
MRARPAPIAADGELPRPRSVSCQEQTGDVGAGNQQDQSNRAQKDVERHARVAHLLID